MVNDGTTSRPGHKSVYAYGCKCTNIHTPSVALSVPYERSKHCRLPAVKQRMREREQNELIKREHVIEATERKGKHRVKRYKQGRKERKIFTYVPE